uniref:hypothetical protein n=1 Tax=Caldalkalibacillus salinus TaxID=2803787 RepID=UPI001F1A9697
GDYRNRKGIVGEIFVRNVAERVMGLNSVLREIKSNDIIAHLDVVGDINVNNIIYYYSLVH